MRSSIGDPDPTHAVCIMPSTQGILFAPNVYSGDIEIELN